MKILALELSSSRGSVAWADDGKEPFVTEFANDRKHSGLFFDALRLCIARFGMPNRIVVGLGPGSYAGTRIAIAAATGLGVAAGAELTGLSSVRAMATAADEYVVVGDARRHSFYFARVQQRRCVEGPTLWNEQQLRERIDTCELPVLSIEPLREFASVTLAYPSAAILTQLAAYEPMQISDAPLEPIYLCDPHITIPKQRARRAAP